MTNTSHSRDSRTTVSDDSDQLSCSSMIAMMLANFGQSVMRICGWSSSANQTVAPRAIHDRSGPSRVSPRRHIDGEIPASGGYDTNSQSEFQERYSERGPHSRISRSSRASPTRDLIKAAYQRGGRRRLKHHQHTNALIALFPQLAEHGLQGPKELKWADFERLMDALDFKKHQGPGAAVNFTPMWQNALITANHLNSTFVTHQPHKPNKPKSWNKGNAQSIGYRLLRQYGWVPEDFLGW
ncbi:hypothetical protein F5Y18DRAFT_432701 [Xylariaceae sp. FL1019]|nr:hypothetical protein F5Y18DRAFT_432701 [Xylariaceae sp. FL1019]